LATGIPARLSPAEGRKFGFTVGGAFLVITALVVWRGRHPQTAYVTGALAAFLMVAALVAPTALGPVNRAWMGLAHLLSKVTTPIFMGVVYFLILAPIGLLMRLFGKDPMVHREGPHGYWGEREGGTPDGARMERQF
jgi:hypothetical protein